MDQSYCRNRECIGSNGGTFHKNTFKTRHVVSAFGLQNCNACRWHLLHPNVASSSIPLLKAPTYPRILPCAAPTPVVHPSLSIVHLHPPSTLATLAPGSLPTTRSHVPRLQGVHIEGHQQEEHHPRRRLSIGHANHAHAVADQSGQPSRQPPVQRGRLEARPR